MLDAGAKLGAYTIVEPIGAGGMGEVYRAHDGKLGRDVAIKVLPAEVADNEQRLARFRREAQLLASLNHPNIAAIHGLEEVDGHPFLVLELVEGEDLAERLMRGPLSLEEARDIARQVAEAVEEAHEKGVVHRDLKPANIKITPDGKVKVLDFGLAKAIAGDAPAASGDLSQSPTMSRQATMAGMILGTASYMSPEQAKGKGVDRRADVWAFGVVVLEMLTGKKPFTGESVSDTLAAVIKDEPRWEDLPAGTPRWMEELLRRCLRKDPRRRLRDIGDARLELEEPHVAGDAIEAPRGRSWIAPLGWIAAALLLVFIVFQAATTEKSVEISTIRAPLVSPDGLRLESLAIAPDGGKIVFAVESASGEFELWIQELDSREANRLPGTEGASDPFWSPDSRQVGFFARASLRTLELESGFVEELANTEISRGGTWNRDGTIVYSSNAYLFSIPSSGGTPIRVLPLDQANGEDAHRYPSFLPDGEHVLFFVRNAADASLAGVWVASIHTGERRRLLDTPSYALYASPGYLLYRRGGNLVARHFDASRLQLATEPAGIVDDLWFDPSISAATSFSVSDNGVLAYRAGGRETMELLWLDRSGRVIDKVWESMTFGDLALSPSANKALLTVASPDDETRQKWVYDLEENHATQVSFVGEHYRSVWSPDETRVMVTSAGGFGWVLQEFDVAARTQAEIRYSGSDLLGVSHWPSEDVVLFEGRGDGQRSIRVLTPRTGEVRIYKDDGAVMVHSEVSHNGRWVAYASNLGSSSDVYVESFPEPGMLFRISTSGGYQPRWSPDDTELFFLAPDRTLVSVRVTESESGFEWEPPVPLFKSPILEIGTLRIVGTYGVGKDGESFLMITRREQPPAPAALLINWAPDDND